MHFRKRLAGFALLIAVILICPVSASYAGDRPLSTAFHTELNGGYLFTVGNSTYGGVLNPGEAYAVAFDITLPPESRILYQRIYLYWGWSRTAQEAIYPEIGLSLSDGTGEGPVLNGRWVDSKGVSGKNDFFSGMDAYGTDPLSSGENHLIVKVENIAADNRSFVVQGAGLLTVYEAPGAPSGTIWVKEGGDMLYSSYGISPEMATSRIDFEGAVPGKRTVSALLELVAPSGGYTKSDQQGINRLLMNRAESGRLPAFIEAIINALFPGYNGKEWIDVFDSDEVCQIGIDRRDVGSYLRPSDNFVAVRDNGDYLLLTNAVLWIETGE